MELLIGLTVFIAISFVYPLLVGGLYFIIVGGILWIVAWLLTKLYNLLIYPIIKGLSLIPIIGKPLAFVFPSLIILSISILCLGVITFPLTVFTGEIFTGEEFNMGKFAHIAFLKSLLGETLLNVLVIPPLGEPDAINAIFPNINSVPITIGKIIFEFPLICGAALASLWLPIRSFFWLMFAWGKAILS